MNPKTAEKYRNGFKVTMHPDELEKPLRWKKPKKIFLCSMGDLFHEDVPFEFITQVMRIIGMAERHTFQILTKRPERMSNFFNGCRTKCNMQLGVTVCNQEEADEKIPVLLEMPAPVRFISIEPMLESITLTQLHYDGLTEINALSGTHGVIRPHGGACNKIDWVIVGGETGRNARPMNPDWVRAIRDQCRASDTPFFFKQMSNKHPIPDDLCVREFPTNGGER
jgi:protein gp37